MEIRNAIIESVTLDMGDRGLLTAYLHLDYGNGGHQGFGGFVLYLPKGFSHHQKDSGFAGHFIFRCMQIAGVESWDKLKGKTVRVKATQGRVEAIGHIVKEDWFCPEIEFKKVGE